MMRLIKTILLPVMVIAFATYTVDCLAMSTPDAAMHCCETMHCSSHGHEQSQECCKTMPSMQAPFIQPSSAPGLSFSPVFVAVLPDFNASQVFDSPASVLTAQCHAPPIPQSATPSPLRI
jgi:hypothetical protein